MKINKKSVAGTAFNFFFVFGLLIAVNGSGGTAPIGTGWEIAIGLMIRIGLPVLFGIIGAIFTYRLLDWLEQIRNEGISKAGGNAKYLQTRNEGISKAGDNAKYLQTRNEGISKAGDND